MTASRQGTSRLVGGSVRGPKHEENGLPCQDSWYGSELPGNRFVIAVGDGLGSASLSHEGSKLATREVATQLEKYLSEVGVIEERSGQKTLARAFDRARTAVFDRAEQEGKNVSEFGTTLLAVAAGPSGIVGAVVGDGGIVCNCQDTYEKLVPREMELAELSSSRYTYPLHHDEWTDSLRFGYRGEFSGVAVFTDGVEEVAWDQKSIQKDFFIELFNLVRQSSEANDAEEQLVNVLGSSPYTEISGDDKTVAVGDLPSDYEQTAGVVDRLRACSERTVRLARNIQSNSLIKTPDEFHNERVATPSGEEIELGEIVSYTESGCVFSDKGSESSLVKILTSTERIRERQEEKIAAMVGNPPTDSARSEINQSFTWPTEIVRAESDGQFLGYRLSVPDIDSADNPLSLAKKQVCRGTDNADGVISSVVRSLPIINDSVDIDSRPLLALTGGVETLHQQGHAVGNLHHTGIHLNGNSQVVMTNCDSYHISTEDNRYTGETAEPRYAPPENRWEKITAVQRGDRFSLAVHIFQLVMGGYHPFRTQSTDGTEIDYEEITRRNPFPYRDPQPGQLEPPRDVPSYEELPSEFQRLFELCFIEGKERPELRPTAQTWTEAIRSI